jgi:16S rRNA processing protein RimM
MSQYFKIGKLAASHGLLGDLILQHHLGKKTALKGLEIIYIQDATDNFIPYFIEKATARSATETQLKLEEINDKEAARLLTPKEVWLESADFKKHAAKSTPISMLGFTLFDQEVELGEIIEVIEQPHQILCTVSYQEKEILIPIHEDNLISIDKRKRKVVVEVPDGLIDIYR